MAMTYGQAAAYLLGAVAGGAEGWVRSSHVIWGATAVTYLGSQIALGQGWTSGITAKEAAKCVFTVCSIYKAIRGMLDDKACTKSLKDDANPAKKWIIWTNTAAGALYTAHLLGILNRLYILPVALPSAAVAIWDAYKTP